jgi:actin-related protein
MPVAHVGGGTRDVDDENLLAADYGNPSTSIRPIASRTDIPQSTARRVLHDSQMHLYHLQPVQGLEPRDSDSRL